jgi:MFS-type transporter involved in bile tolerance (Atg22 family)
LLAAKHFSKLFSRILAITLKAVMHPPISGINAPCRTYLSKATYESERTTHVALFSLFQTMGFILGPAVQGQTI